MSITLIKVASTNIRVTDSVTFPIIKAVIQTTGSATGTEMNSLFAEIYSRSIGMVSLCSMWAYQEEPYDLQGDAVGNRTWGDDTGFKVNSQISGRTGSGSNWSTSVSSKVWYKGDLVCSIPVFTGYSHWENNCGIIFVDESNYIYKVEGQFYTLTGLYLLGSDNPGYSVLPGYVVASVVNPDLSLYGGGTNTTFTLLEDISPYITGEFDPYTPGGESVTGGGTGDFDNTGDDIDFPALPSLGATDTGFISLFNPTLQELKDLASYMWSSSFDVALYKKLFADPMECILGLSIVPVSIPDAGRGFISIGNMVTPVWMNRAGAQYIEVDCGSINVNEYWGSYLDYEPHTKAEIYLPYCGIHPISIDDIMGKTVAVKYHVDILSGACCAYVKCGNAVLYTFIGQCASSIPITGNDWTNVINGVLSAAVSVGTMVATGGLTAPMAASSIASTAVNGIKPSIEKSGAMGGTGGMLAIQTPYLILTRPRQALPSRQNTYLGYPSFITANLGSMSGYTEIETIHLHDIPATSEELSEIENLLKTGVIL